MNNDILSLIIAADYIPQMESQSAGLVFMLACHAETNSSNCAGTAPVAVTALVDMQTAPKESFPCVVCLCSPYLHIYFC